VSVPTTPMFNMTDRFPGYDVLAKHDGLSWNGPTRRAIDERLAVRDEPLFFTPEAYRILQALCDRILPQPERSEKIPLAAYLARHLQANGASGTRYEPMPYDGEAWNIGLRALDTEAREIYGVGFPELFPENADALLTRCQNGALYSTAWGQIPPAMFFKRRILSDIPAAYYAHPKAWNEMGFGGPASPRGYVRMQANRRDPWEAAEAYSEDAGQAAKKNAKIR
jgi:Gluconate 2-dehydrogenase subunit 3